MKKCSISFSNAGLKSESDLISAWICDLAATAISLSLRSVLPSSLCSASMTPTRRDSMRQPQKAGSSIKTSASSGSPSSATVPGNAAEIEREKRALRQDTLEHVSFTLHIVGKFTSTSLRCVDDNVQRA